MMKRINEVELVFYFLFLFNLACIEGRNRVLKLDNWSSACQHKYVCSCSHKKSQSRDGK